MDSGFGKNLGRKVRHPENSVHIKVARAARALGFIRCHFAYPAPTQLLL
jgi:hypothetical protein